MNDRIINDVLNQGFLVLSINAIIVECRLKSIERRIRMEGRRLPQQILQTAPKR